MVNYVKNNKCLNLNVKTPNKKSVTQKEITPPVLRRTMKICTEKTNMSTVKKSYECVDRGDLEIAYENRSAESTEYYCPMPLPLSVQDTLEDISKNIDDEIAPSSLEEKWIHMTGNEKNQWIKKYLYRIKNEVVNVYKIISDFQKGDLLQDELSELSSILSMVDIIPHDRLKSTINIQKKHDLINEIYIEQLTEKKTATEHDYLTVAIQLKELQERHKDVILEHEKSKRLIKSLKEELNKEKHDKDTQTYGIKVEELENSLKNVTSEKSSLCLKLELENVNKTKLKHELDVKNNELKAMSMQNFTLNKKLETLLKTVKEVEKLDKTKSERIENLCVKKNKFKHELIDVSRERDEATEELFELKNKLTKIENELIKAKSYKDKQRLDVIQRSIQFSDQTDELNTKTNQIKFLKETISKNEERIKYLERENFGQTSMIVDLEDNNIKLKSELDSWETRAGCWVNEFVRQEFETKIADHKKQIDQLKLENKQLSRMHNNSMTEISKKKADNERIVEKKEKIIQEQNTLIKLMRKVQNHQMTKNNDVTVQKLVDDVFQKFSNSQELMEENIRLRRIVDEYK